MAFRVGFGIWPKNETKRIVNRLEHSDNHYGAGADDDDDTHHTRIEWYFTGIYDGVCCVCVW